MATHGKISFWSAVLMSINIIVGAGILFYPKEMALVSGSMSFLGWPLVGLLMFPVIWSIAQASKIFPGEGGFYNYCSTGINPTAGFIAHWFYLLGYMGSAATTTTVLRENLISQAGLSFCAQHPLIFNAIAIAIFSLLNLMSITLISKTQSIATLAKMLPLFFVILILPFYWNPTITYAVSDLSNLGLAIPFAIFGYWGFEACCSLGHLLEGGPSQVGKVILTAFFVTVTLYTLFHLGIMNIMGLNGLIAQGPIGFPQFMGLGASLTSFLGVGIAGAMILSFANSVFGISLGNITNLHMIAQKRLMIGAQALNPVNQFGRPTIAIIVHAIMLWTLLYLIPGLVTLTAITNIGVTTAFVLTLVALFLTYLKTKNHGQLAITILAFASCGMLVYFSWISISPNVMDRFLYIMPLLIGGLVGFVMYKLAQVRVS